MAVNTDNPFAVAANAGFVKAVDALHARLVPQGLVKNAQYSGERLEGPIAPNQNGGREIN